MPSENMCSGRLWDSLRSCMLSASAVCRQVKVQMGGAGFQCGFSSLGDIGLIDIEGWSDKVTLKTVGDVLSM